jgi:putative endonuclease
VHTRELGSIAEDVAASFLMLQGYKVLERNYRFRTKEIDIVCAQGARVVFVEVKFRRTSRRGLPREAVDQRKRRQIIFAARGFLAERDLGARPCRFDVIEIRTARAGAALVVEHIVGAFDAGGGR